VILIEALLSQGDTRRFELQTQTGELHGHFHLFRHPGLFQGLPCRSVSPSNALHAARLGWSKKAGHSDQNLRPTQPTSRRGLGTAPPERQETSFTDSLTPKSRIWPGVFGAFFSIKRKTGKRRKRFPVYLLPITAPLPIRHGRSGYIDRRYWPPTS
jgi:hypothetical protein